jgi:CPA2 family monovalent cation:H+ antiporter-2
MIAAANINITAYSDALVVLGTAGVLIPLFRRWGLNPVLGYFAAGAILGPFGLGSFINSAHFLYWFTIVDSANVAGIAELGIVFLLFVIGLDLSFERLAAMRLLVGGFGSLQVLLCATVITAAGLIMGLRPHPAIILGASFSLSSTAIVLEILSKQDRMSTNLGKVCFAVLLAQDLAAMPVLMFLSIGASSSGESVAASLLRAFLQASVAVAVIVAFGRYLMRPLFRLVATAHSSELFIATVLFVVIGTGVIAHQAGLSMALGAFLAGLLLADTEFQKAIQASVEPFKGLLLGLFFFTVGMRVDIRELARYPGLLVGCVLGVIVVKAVIVAGLARLFRFSWPTAIEAGLLLGPGGEFAFVIIGIAADLALLSRRVSGFSIAVTSVTMATTPLLSVAGRRLAPLFSANIGKIDPEIAVSPPRPPGNAIVVGYGRVGKVVCSFLRQHEIPYVAADYDPSAVAADRRNGHEVYFGDAADPEFLRTCGLEEAAAVIITINARNAIDGIVAHVRAMRPDIPIISRARDAGHARHLYEIGASEAVPETIGASFQLSEAALVGLGVDQKSAVASVQKTRVAFRSGLQSRSQVTVDRPK